MVLRPELFGIFQSPSGSTPSKMKEKISKLAYPTFQQQMTMWHIMNVIKYNKLLRVCVILYYFHACKYILYVYYSEVCSQLILPKGFGKLVQSESSRQSQDITVVMWIHELWCSKHQHASCWHKELQFMPSYIFKNEIYM